MSVFAEKADRLCALLQNAPIVIEKTDSFPFRLAGAEQVANLLSDRWTDPDTPITARYKREEPLLWYTAGRDFSHTVPLWDRLLALGFPGLTADVCAAAENAPANAYLQAAKRVFDSIPVYLLRAAEEAERTGRCADRADDLRELVMHAPRTLSEALTFMIVWYHLQTETDGIVLRSFGGLDELLAPFVDSAHEKEEDELLKRFMLQLRDFRFGANIPFYLGGTDREGRAFSNELSFRLLRLYASLHVQDPKIQIRVRPDTPEELLRLAGESIKAGCNSIVLMNDPVVIGSLEKIGVEHEDARRYTPVGCYEPCAREEVPCTCACRVNLAKTFELALHNGFDPLHGLQLEEDGECATFEDFFDRFTRWLARGVDRAYAHMMQFESRYEEDSASLIYSPSFPSSLKAGRTMHAGGAKYNDSSLNAFGLATAADALCALKRLVWDEKRFTLREVSELMQNDWAGQESLRLFCRAHLPKYGSGQSEADEMAARIVRAAANLVNGRKNVRGGVFRLGTFSIDWYGPFGQETGATPDGRHARDVLSKNMSSAIGCDKAGVTGLLSSAASVDYTLIPNGTALDLCLDASAVRGSDGAAVLSGLVRAFFKKGGLAIQINVLDPAVLRAAQAHPDEYATLQVRLCGWNVYFVNLSAREQEEFIAMAEHAAGVSA